MKNIKTAAAAQSTISSFYFSQKEFFFFCLVDMDVVVTKKPRPSSEQLSVKFRAESDKSQVLTQATPHSAGHDLYAAEAKTILPKDMELFR